MTDLSQNQILFYKEMIKKEILLSQVLSDLCVSKIIRLVLQLVHGPTPGIWWPMGLALKIQGRCKTVCKKFKGD